MRQVHLKRNFFARDTHLVAKQLLGKLLIRQLGKKKLIARITDVEAYVGEDDLACHATRGRTPRTAVMYGPPGHAYIYLIYGIHYCLNIVTEPEGLPAAILIRGAVIVPPQVRGRLRGGFKIDGPGKLTRALEINKSLNAEDLTTSKNLYVADDGLRVPRSRIKTSPRINVAYAGACAAYPWRYFIE